MQREKFNNIINGNSIVTSSDFSPNEKRALFALMSAKGLAPSTAYFRFFKEGFSVWEVDGINAVIKEFIVQEGMDLPYTFDPVLFYEALPVKRTFKDFMQAKGMGRKTVVVRFTNGNFKSWELEGIRNIIENNIDLI